MKDWKKREPEEALCFECEGKGHFSRDHWNPQKVSQQAKEDITEQDIRGNKRRRVNLAIKEEENDSGPESEPQDQKLYQGN
jgi:hypothetical protein